jgi:hypothetical protein
MSYPLDRMSTKEDAMNKPYAEMTWTDHVALAEQWGQQARENVQRLEGVEMDPRRATVTLAGVQLLVAQAQLHATLALAKK